jgi:hypothetical protein
LNFSLKIWTNAQEAPFLLSRMSKKFVGPICVRMSLVHEVIHGTARIQVELEDAKTTPALELATWVLSRFQFPLSLVVLGSEKLQPTADEVARAFERQLRNPPQGD